MLNLVKDYDIKESDLNGALNGLRLLISTYKFNLTDFANGKISIPEAQRIDMDISEEYFEDTPLIVHDLHLLGQLAYNEKNLVQSIDILTAAEKLAKERKDPLYKDIKHHLKTVIKKHDELRLRSQVDPKFILHHKPIGNLKNDKNFVKSIKISPFITDPELAKKKKYAKLPTKLPMPKLFKPNTDTTDSQILFDAACRGEVLRDPKDDIGINCQFLHYYNPYLKLGPFKMETKNIDPFVAIFRDFFGESEMKSYLDEANNSGQMKRSTHGGSRFGEASTYVASYSRTSKQTWIQELRRDLPDGLVQEGFLLPIANQVSFRVQNATLMNVFTANGGEAYQVANYGIGGQYSKHLDASGADRVAEPFKGVGDRIQTFMGYLVDVEAGGATAFPLLGLSVWPRKGDAITWYNLRRNGQNDPLTLHGGCPVIKGSKWITNKWIRQFPQLLNFPCNVEKNSDFLPPLQNDICKVVPNCKPRFGLGAYSNDIKY